MSEAFKPVRITLSEEAFDRLEKIMNDAKFRSYSSTIEECIRVVYDLMKELELVLGKKDDPHFLIEVQDELASWSRVVMRMYRFTGRRVSPQKTKLNPE